jgi:hypothetical protein
MAKITSLKIVKLFLALLVYCPPSSTEKTLILLYLKLETAMGKNLFMFLIALFILSCTHHSFYLLEGGGKRPVKPDFKLKDINMPADLYDIIDTNAVYITTLKGFNDDGGNLYEALRFFSNGRVYRSFMYDSLDKLKEKYNEPNNSGFIGYFTFRNERVVTEVFINNQYGIDEFKLVPNGLLLHRSKERSGRKYGTGDVFEKKVDVNLIGSANW